MDGRLELRKLPPGPLYRLVQILEAGQSWKQLMSMVPKLDNDCAQQIPKYTVEHIKLVERAGETQRRACAEIFLDEWGTSGRERPDLRTLLRLLVEAELFRAAEYVAVDLLKDSAPVRPATGPSAAVDTSEETIQKLVPLLVRLTPSDLAADQSQAVADCTVITPGEAQTFNSDVLTQVDREMLTQADTTRANCEVVTQAQPVIEADTLERLVQMQDTVLVQPPIQNSVAPPLATRLPHHPYATLLLHTGGFSDARRLGTGAFGSVYLAALPGGRQVAVKRLNEDAVNVERQFRNEVEALSKFHHPNLLPLLGYCCDGPSYCLVYEYMSNGSLHERLASKVPLPWQVRVNIAFGTSKGILHLHTAFDQPLIHRDIKTANILLDENLVPKLGDFGLVRLGSNGMRSQSVALTTTVFGTSAYMAPEAFRGDISVKIDTFSFGVVLLELLTSLPPYDEHREGCDLVTHVEEICEGSVKPLLDETAGDWGNSDVADALYEIALTCLEEKRRRPNMGDVVTRLERVAAVTNVV